MREAQFRQIGHHTQSDDLATLCRMKSHKQQGFKPSKHTGLIVFGANKIFKIEHLDDGSLLIHSVFLTLQGEGPHSGSPAVFVRSAKCSLACSWCDTYFDSPDDKRYSPQALADLVEETGRGTRAELCVITGGEPMRQNLTPFIEELMVRQWKVQIETAGIHWVNNLPNDTDIVCSPKTSQINSTIKVRATCFKYIIDAREEMDPRNGLPKYAVSQKGVPNTNPMWHPHPMYHSLVYLQPLDSKDEGYDWNKSADLCAQNAIKHGYRVSLQQHKILNLP